MTQRQLCIIPTEGYSWLGYLKPEAVLYQSTLCIRALTLAPGHSEDLDSRPHKDKPTEYPVALSCSMLQCYRGHHSLRSQSNKHRIPPISNELAFNTSPRDDSNPSRMHEPVVGSNISMVPQPWIEVFGCFFCFLGLLLGVPWVRNIGLRFLDWLCGTDQPACS